MIDIGVATCAAVPDLDEDGGLLLAALAEAGARARPVVWDDEAVDWGAFDLVGESLLFGATDISILRTPLWLPQGLWAFGIAVFLVLIVLMLAETTLLVLSGRGDEAEAYLHARTYDEEAAEALEAVGAAVPGEVGKP